MTIATSCHTPWGARDAGSFSIDSRSGQLKTGSGLIYDYEDPDSKNTYSVTVTAEETVTAEDGSQKKSATIDVTIDVENEREPPLPPARPSVSSTSAMSLGVIWTAPDNEGRPDITGYDVQYRQGTSGAWMNFPRRLSQSTRSADISGLNGNTLYQVRVRARNDEWMETDDNWSLPGSGRTLDGTNNAPTFNEGATTTRNVKENEAPGTDVGSEVMATDFNDDTLTYRLGGQDAALFRIDSGTGQLKTKVMFDHEAKSTYTVTVTADDGKGGTAVIAVEITVTDENEPPDPPDPPTVTPGPTPSSQLSVAWNPPADNAGRPDITDYDLQFRKNDPNAPWVSWGHDDTETRALIDMGPVADMEYEVRVKAHNLEGMSDWSMPGTGRTAASTVNNTPPTFGDTPLTRSFPENAPAGYNVGPPVTATDGQGDTLTYSLDGTDAGSFTIDGSSGQIRTRRGEPYDYETKDTYHVIVKADDGQDSGTAAIPVTIKVIDVDKDGGTGTGGTRSPSGGRAPAESGEPAFASSSTKRSFPENTPPGQNIGAPVAAKVAVGSLTYTFSGADAVSLDINSKTGQLKTKAGVTYDYETKDTYIVTVKATSLSGLSDTIVVTIDVTDVDEKPATPDAPVVNAPDGSSTSLVVTWTAPDTNGGPPLTDYDVEYRQGVTGDWRDWPHDGTGTTTTLTELRAHSDYQVRVRVFNDEAWSDWSPPGNGQTNNTVPAFASAEATRSFPENTPAGQDIGEPVAASDPDGDPLTYSLEGPDAPSFEIEAETGQLKTKAGISYDHEVKSSYTVTVRATDPLDADGTIEVTILVTDVNEEPAFDSDATVRSFPENTPAGQDIGEPVAASDPDGDPLTYSLEGPDASSFEIEAETGQLKTRAGVTYDHETRDAYSVTAKVTDGSDLSDTIAVTILVTDVPEKPATPAAPTVRAQEGTSTSLLVNWTAPDTNGGPPLTDYDVEYRQGTSGDWIAWPHDGTATTATITELGAGTDYEVRVRAFNDEAWSDWSPPGRGRTNIVPKGWLARFGRTIAQQMLEGVEDRLASPCHVGLQGTLAGYGFGGKGDGVPYESYYQPALGDDLEAQRLDPQLLTGSVFSLGDETANGGLACVWGRGAHASFNGRGSPASFDGDVTTSTLGADYGKGPWTVGLALSHSRGKGNHDSDASVTAAAMGLYPYAGYKVTERLSVWGLGGFGHGGLTVKPGNDPSLETDISLVMVAAGVRSLLFASTYGAQVAFKTDGFWVRMASDAAVGLLAAKGDASRLRFGLESSYIAALKNGGTLTPKFDIGWRYDGGGAETGLGVDIGGGLAWSAPVWGISAEIVVRHVLVHEAIGFNDWSVSGLVRYDPNPSSERGAALALRSSIGPPSLDGANALLKRETMAEQSALNPAGSGQLTVEAAYGFPILGGRFTGAPWVGMGLLENGRDYRVGYRISPAGQFGSHIQVGIEGIRRENDYGEAVTEHAIGLRLALGW